MILRKARIIMKNWKRTIYRAVLKGTLMTASLLLCLLLISIAYRSLSASQGGSAETAPDGQTSGSGQNDSDSGLSYAARSVPDSIMNAPDSSVPESTAADPEHSGSGKNPGHSGRSEAENAKARDTTLVFAGDAYFSDYVLAAYEQSGIQGVLEESLLKELTRADITMLNNEFPYSTRGTPAPDKQFTFRIDPSYVSILKESGTDLVTLANNHVLDYGTDALNDTFQTLDEAGIDYAGAGNSLERADRLIIKQANGHSFGFLAASRVFPVASWNVENAQPGVFSAYDPSKLLEAVSDARKQCDFVCVYLHWGIERNTVPEQYQISMAHSLIDAGADAVIGAHPHVLQGVEYYHGKPVFYSLGNFIFYQSIERTAIARLTLSADNTATWQLLPAKASGACTSLIRDPAACQDFYQYMTGLSVNARFSEDGQVIPEN